MYAPTTYLGVAILFYIGASGARTGAPQYLLWLTPLPSIWGAFIEIHILH